jgi:hypothetical protein
MPGKRTLNKRRLTRTQVQKLVASGARPRPDLSAKLEETFSTGYSKRPLVYELEGNRFLFVFDEQEPGLAGKGDIYPAAVFLRLVQWTAKVREDYACWRGDAVSHWAYYSTHRDHFISHVEALIERLRSTMSRSRDELDFSYRSLDIVSDFVERIGIERAQKDFYDHLVAYVGEVLRQRIEGQWELNPKHVPPYPYLLGPKHHPTMPINVVWGELSGLDPANLRAAAANEVRRTRKLPVPSTPQQVPMQRRRRESSER